MKYQCEKCQNEAPLLLAYADKWRCLTCFRVYAQTTAKKSLDPMVRAARGKRKTRQR